MYGRPVKIQVIGMNGYTRVLDRDEFVIMYDNNGRYPLWLDVLQYAERLALILRTIDINVAQQKTPRIWRTKTEMVKTLEDLINNVDGNENQIMGYNSIDLDETSAILQPAPYVSEQLDLLKDKVYNEFLRLIGIANISYQKRERQISDEIRAMQGGTVASRYSRFEPRKKAIEEINEKFKLNISVKYYDGIPTTDEELDSIFPSDLIDEIDINKESGVDNNE